MAIQISTVVPLYRLYNPAADDHFYTTDALERQAFLAQGNYRTEGIAAWVCSEMFAGTLALCRLYNGTDHFYTVSAEERDRAIADGYRSEGHIAFVFSRAVTHTVPLYRLRQRQTGNHFYTISSAEAIAACKKLGFVREGVAAYVYATQPASP